MSNAHEQKHVIDCFETNAHEVNRQGSITFANYVHKISPGLVSVGDHPKNNDKERKS